MPDWLDRIKRGVGSLTELVLLLAALAIVLQVLIGQGNMWIFADVIGHLMDIITQIGDRGIVGLIAVAVVLWLFSRRTMS